MTKILLLILFAAVPAFADIPEIREASSGGGFTAGQDVTASAGVFDTLQSTGTAPSATLNGLVVGGGSSATVTGAATVSGNLGIGTASPGAKLHVSGTSLFEGGAVVLKSSFSNHGNAACLGSAGVEYCGVEVTASNEGNINIGYAATNRGVIAHDYGSTMLTISQAYDAASGMIRFRNRTSGTPVNSLLLVSTGAWTPALTQDVAKSCSTGVTSDADGKLDGCVASDLRLKTGIVAYSAPSKFDLLRPVTYRFKKEPERKRLGFIAQDIEKLYPEAVVPAGAGGMKGIDSNAMIAVLVKEIQDLRARVKALEKK